MTRQGWQVTWVAVIVAVGVVLSWLSAVHPAAMPTWGPWDFSWPTYLGAAFGVLVYLQGLASMAAEERPATWRSSAYVSGVVLIYAVLQTRFEYLALHLFSLNRVQHMAMHHLGPFLIGLAWPGEVLRRGAPRRVVRLVGSPIVRATLGVLQQPVITGVLFAGLIILWLTPWVHVRSMLDPPLYAFMNFSMVADGLLFWFLVLDPRDRPPARLSFAVRLMLVLAVQVPQVMAGAAIALAQADLYPVYALCGRILPIRAVLDQQIGGFVVYFPGAMMSTVAALILFRRLWRAEANRSAFSTAV